MEKMAISDSTANLVILEGNQSSLPRLRKITPRELIMAALITLIPFCFVMFIIHEMHHDQKPLQIDTNKANKLSQVETSGKIWNRTEEPDVTFNFTIREPRTEMECIGCEEWMRGFVQIFYQTSAYSEELISIGYGTEINESFLISPKRGILDLQETYILEPPPFLSLFNSGRNSIPGFNISYSTKVNSFEGIHPNISLTCDDNHFKNVTGIKKNFCDDPGVIKASTKEIAVLSFLFGVEEFQLDEANVTFERTGKSFGNGRILAKLKGGDYNLARIKKRITEFEMERENLCLCNKKQFSLFKNVQNKNCLKENPSLPEMTSIFKNYFLCHGEKVEVKF